MLKRIVVGPPPPSSYTVTMTGAPESETRSFRPGMFIFGLVVFLFAASCGLLILSDLRGSMVAAVILLLILLAFASGGVLIMKLAWKLPEIEREQRLRKARYPGQPWRWRMDWEQGFATAEYLSKGRFRFGEHPGVPGGALHGRLETGGQTQPGERIEFTLECVSKAKMSRSNIVRVKWQAKTLATADGQGCDVTLPIPAGLPDYWTDETWGRQIYWRLIARGESGYEATFTVPVFKS